MATANATFQELRARLQAGRTVCGALREELIATGLPSVDDLLLGGLPYGSLVVFEGGESAGCRSVAATLLAAATRRGLGAIIDSGDLYPPDLEAAGVRLDRLLIVPARTALSIARVVDVLLRSRTVRVVVMAAAGLRAAVWMRLANLAQKAGALLLVLARNAASELCAAAAVRLRFRTDGVHVLGTHGLWGLFTGFGVRAELRKHKRVAV
jgi:hypothetical protein